MKKKIVSLLLFAAIVFASLTLSSCGQIKSKNAERPNDIPASGTSEYNDESIYETVSETDNIKFEYNKFTTDIRLTNKKTGFKWDTEYLSNDDGIETIYRGEVFTLTYYTTTGAIKTMTSSDDAVAKGQFRTTKDGDTLKVQYGLGDVNYVIDFPLALSIERRDYYFNQMDENQQSVFNTYYELFNFNDEIYKDKDQYNDDDLKTLKDKYPLAAKNEEGWYYMTSSLSDTVLNSLHELFVTGLGYTMDDFKKDSDGVNVSEIDRAEFNVEIDYTLEGDNLRVTIPENKIYYADNYTIESIQLHPNLMDFDNSYSGYYLVPDGSGSLLNFNNGKDEIRNDAIYVQMYGVDEARGIDEKMAYYNNAILPVYGCCLRGKNAKTATVVDETGVKEPTNALSELTKDTNPAKYNGLFATIESGESFAGVEAHSGSVGEMPSHNRIFTEFRVNECQKIKSFSSNASNDETYSKYQFQMYQGNIEVVYHLLSGEESTYSGMANYYKSQLFRNEKTEKQDYYSTVETVGTINGNGLFMGISYNSKVAMTTFDSTAQIAEDLKKNGFNNMNIKLSGWCNGGYEHGYLNNVKVSNQLGGNDGLKKLIEKMDKDGIGLYPDVDYQYVYWAEKTPSKKDNSSALNGSRNDLSSFYSPVNFRHYYIRDKYALTVDAMKYNLDSFLTDYSQYNLNNISLRSIGAQITANYRQDDFCERQETLENLVKQVSEVKDKKYSIMGTQGDAPFLKYLDVVNQMPITSAGYDKSDYSVPFTSMVLSGHINYTSDIVNLSNNDRLDLLQMIEAGSGAYYLLTGIQYDDISYTAYEDWYSTKYENIKDNVLSTYKYLSGALNDVYGLSITKHTILADGVNMTTYENGTSIVVNYNDSDYSANGVTCKAKDYAVVKGA